MLLSPTIEIKMARIMIDGLGDFSASQGQVAERLLKFLVRIVVYCGYKNTGIEIRLGKNSIA